MQFKASVCLFCRNFIDWHCSVCVVWYVECSLHGIILCAHIEREREGGWGKLGQISWISEKGDEWFVGQYYMYIRRCMTEHQSSLSNQYMPHIQLVCAAPATTLI